MHAREMGFNLKINLKDPAVNFQYRGNSYQNDVTIASEGNYSGTWCNVDLKSATSCQDRAYVGDFHVHPYRKRYAPDTVAIGPSYTDWRSWHNCFPTKGFAFFFVSSNTTLFLIVAHMKCSKLPEMEGLEADGKRELEGNLYNFHTITLKRVHI